MKKRITVPFFIPHLGCPHQCVFCNQRAITGHEAIPDAADIPRLTLEYRSTSGNLPAEIAFFGGSFTGLDGSLQEQYLDEAQKCVKTGLADGIRLSTRPDYIDDEVCARLSRYEVKTVELGVQSFDDEVLALAKRGHTAEDVFAAAKMLHKYRIDCVIQLMPGLPGDTLEKSVLSAQKAVDCGIVAARIYPAVVIEGTELAEIYRDHKFVPMTIEEAVERCAAMTEIFNKNNVSVIRTGLHPVKDETGKILAGPYHTAFGFFVKARIRRNELAEKLDSFIALHGQQKTVSLDIPRKNAEEYIGSRRENITWLENTFDLTNLKITISESTACPTFFTD